MRAATWMLLICLLIGLFNSDFCGASPIEDVAYDDYRNDDNFDYDAEDSGTEAPLVAVEEVNAPPYFEQEEIFVKAKPGDDVILNCDARNFDITNVALWYKKDQIVSNGPNAINNRFEALRNNSLRLAGVTPEDGGDYYCAILPQNVRQHTTLTVAARLSILCDDRDVTDRSQTFKQGDHHRLVCQTFLPTKTDIKWSLNGQRLTSAGDPASGVIVLDNVDEEDAGVYQCLGDDGSNDPPHGMINVDVQYSPKVSTHRHHVNTQEGGSAEIYCDYRANPIAISFFIKDGKTLSLSDKYSIKNSLHKQHNRTTLIVKNTDDSDLGEYLCHVENSIGSNEVRVQLSYAPETPQFENSTIEGNKVTMHWLVRSLQPLSEAVLDYKLSKSIHWSTVSMIKTQHHNHDKESGIWKITHEMELTPGLWHVRVKTKNTVGWSNFAPNHDVVIKDPEDSSVETPPEDLVRAGFGIGGGDSEEKKNAACTFSLVPALIMSAGSIALLRL
ncbi:hemicentin-2 [Drosophila sulfurigaster albostrigata]|uniref:hemicentin-2 n=1 Tax=Drosophila sulfurigaster albostrigata TaxID=89887 RepID=UPI002D21D41E|nr:hemicentin-2 [Drosophila sulfurigaster albostrigata]XP_062129405.1 hemicentin-2 [Drosophila sulfurigaster albostrigata]